LALDGDESGAGGGHCVRTLRQLATAPRRPVSDGAYAGIRRHVQTVLWVRACHSAMLLTLSMLRTRNCTEEYNEMIYAETPEAIEKHRKAFIRKWRLKHEAVANSLEEAGDRLFTAAQPVAQRAHHQRDPTATRGVQVQDQNADCTAVGLPRPDYNMRKVDGWKTLATKPID
jgi:hypothetical protein